MNTTKKPYEDIVSSLASSQPLFRALGDLTRQEILLLLTHEDRLSVGEVAARTRLSRPAVSHHLRLLKEAGLLRETRVGVRRYYQPSFHEAIESMELLVNKISKVKELL